MIKKGNPAIVIPVYTEETEKFKNLWLKVIVSEKEIKI